VFVGLNPSPVSVQRGHYYQGRLGQRFWNRLREYGLLPAGPDGAEDDIAFSIGYGFIDLIRRPTARSKELPRTEILAAVPELLLRLRRTGDSPVLVFVFARARKVAGPFLEREGYRVMSMPGPFAPMEEVREQMERLKIALKVSLRSARP
jgi:TDG/mug DNA glycosylase family protein